MPTPRVTVWRSDSGGPNDEGDYQCSACPWTATRAKRSTPRKHVRRVHNRGVNVERTKVYQRIGKPDEELKQDPVAVASRTRKRQLKALRQVMWGTNCVTHHSLSHANPYLAHLLRPSPAFFFQEEADRAKRLNRAEARWPMTITKDGQLSELRAFYSAGNGRRKVIGGADEIAVEGYEVSFSFVALNTRRLRSWAGGGDSNTKLITRAVDLTISADKLRVRRSQPSGSVCGALALMLLLGGQLMEGQVVITGSLDLRGRINMVGAVEEKIMHAMRQGVEQLFIPAINLKKLELEGWPAAEDEVVRQYMAESVHGVANVVEMLKIALKSFDPPPDAAALLDGTHVGVCFCRGLGKRDNVGDIQIQCCWREPSSRETLITGGVSYTTKEAVAMMENLVESHALPIAQALCLEAKHARAPLSLFKPGCGLHVHVEHSYCHVHPTYQMGAIYMAMASLMVGRKISDKIMVFGEVTNTGRFSADKWELTQEDIEPWWDEDCRKAIFGEGVKLASDAEAFAAEIDDEDGKPRIELVRTVTHILDVVRMVLGHT